MERLCGQLVCILAVMAGAIAVAQTNVPAIGPDPK